MIHHTWPPPSPAYAPIVPQERTPRATPSLRSDAHRLRFGVHTPNEASPLQ